MLNEEIHSRLVPLGEQQGDEDGGVAHHNEDKEDPQKGQLFHLVEIDGAGGGGGAKDMGGGVGGAGEADLESGGRGEGGHGSHVYPQRNDDKVLCFFQSLGQKFPIGMFQCLVRSSSLSAASSGGFRVGPCSTFLPCLLPY